MVERLTVNQAVAGSSPARAAMVLLKAKITCLSYARANLVKVIRPLKLTDEVKKTITTALAAGCTRTAAFGAASISRTQFYTWMREIPAFKKCVEDAEANARLAIESRLASLAVDGDRFAIMYYLQNRYPEDWKDTRNFKVDQTLAIDDKRKSEATDDEIMDILEGEGVDCSQFRSDDYEPE